MAKSPSHQRPGFHSVTPALIVDDCAAAIPFYAKAFGAVEKARDLGPGGKIWHCEVQIGDSLIMLSDEFPEMGSKSAKTIGDAPGGLWLYVPDVDATHRAAVAAGATSIRPPNDEFWGDRMAIVEDPFGHTWTLATWKETLTPAEMQERREAAMRQFAQRP